MLDKSVQKRNCNLQTTYCKRYLDKYIYYYNQLNKATNNIEADYINNAISRYNSSLNTWIKTLINYLNNLL
jgi:hypothetical protein